MGVSKKQLFDAIGLVKEYVDEKSTSNGVNEVDHMVEEIVHRSKDFFEYTDGCDMSQLVTTHDFNGNGNSDLPILDGWKFIIVALHISRTVYINGKYTIVYNSESKIIPVEMWMSDLRPLKDSQLVNYDRLCIHRIKVDLVTQDPSTKTCRVHGAVTMSFILWDGRIDIIGYDVESASGGADDMTHSISLEIRYALYGGAVFIDEVEDGVVDAVVDDAVAVE